MTSRSILDYSAGKPKGRRSWVDVVTLAALVVGYFNLASSPLILSTPGGFVDSYLWVAGGSIIALTFARRRWLIMLALILGAFAIVLIHRDHHAGMEHMQKRARENTMMEFRIPPYDK